MESQAKTKEKRKRPTKAEMKSRNRAVAMAAAILKAEYDRLPTVDEISTQTKLSRSQVYVTAPYKEGKISKKSTKVPSDMTVNSAKNLNTTAENPTSIQ